MADERLSLAENVVDLLEITAIVVIVVAVAWSFLMALFVARGQGTVSGLAAFKRSFSRGLLIGLDVLIAADVIQSVTVDQTLENAAALGLIVLVRIVLSVSLIVEIEERWPWRPAER